MAKSPVRNIWICSKELKKSKRKVRALRKSPFCQTMAGCTVVRSPIQRTNLMMKDPYYRTCYKLWQFIESYDDIGYTIDEQDTAIEMDEDYLVRMYTNLITNYTVFKSLTSVTAAVKMCLHREILRKSSRSL